MRSREAPCDRSSSNTPESFQVRALWLACLFLLPSGNEPVVAQRPLTPPILTGPIRISRAIAFGLDLPIGRPTDAVLRPDDSVCISDMGFFRVSCWSREGRHLFNSGRQGQGPGEFTLPYRIAALSDGSVVVLDIGTAAFSVLTQEGGFSGRQQIPIMFAQVNGMLALQSGMLALSGFAPTAGYSADKSIHVFSLGSNVRHVRSFGALPRANSREVLSYWGAGRMTRSLEGLILYAQRIPYQLQWYDVEGRLVRDLTVPAPVSVSADVGFATIKDLSSTTVSVTSDLVIAPGTAIQVTPALVLAQRIGTRRGQVEEVWWDYVSTDGRLLSSEKLPNSFRIVDLIGLSHDGSILFGIGLVDEEPCIVRLEIQVLRSAESR